MLRRLVNYAEVVSKRFDWESTPIDLEAVRKAVNDRIDLERERVNKKLDEKLAALNGKMSGKQEEIIAASLELLKSGGLNELSLRDIAKKLNIKAPALYWYFKSKSELVDHMAEKILSKEFEGAKPRAEGELWQDWLAGYMGKLRKAMLAYPDGGRVVAGAHLYPTKTLAQVFEDSIVSLTSAGVEELRAFYTAMTAVQFAFGFVIEEQSSPEDQTIEREAALKSLLEQGFEKNYPNLANAAKKFEANKNGRDEAFAFGIQIIIKGAEAMK